MNVIKTQATSHILVNYIATIFSFFALILIYPLDENKGYGQAQFVSMTAMFLVPFVALGTHSMTVKFFPDFKDEMRRGYLGNVMLIAMTAFVLFFTVAFFFRDPLYNIMSDLNFDVRYLRQHIVPVIITTFFIMFARIFTLHSSNYDRIAIPAILNNFVPKVALPVLILLVFLNVIEYMEMVWWWTGVFGFITVALLIYLARLGALDVKWRPQDLRNGMLGRMVNYSLYNGLAIMGSMLANRLDVIMVTLLLGDKQNGVYMTALFIAATIQIPSNAVWQITSPQLAKAWNANNLKEIDKLYKRSSTNLFVVGVLLYFLFLGNIDAVFSLTANYEALAAGIPAFALLGASKLFDMLTSINTQIIMYSKAFKVNTLFVVILGISNVVMNYFFIGWYGLTGAALATGISVLLYNVLKTTYIYVKYGMHPFGQDIWRVMLFGGLCGAAYFIFPRLPNPFLHMALFTIAMGGLSLGLIYVLKINTDFIPFFRSKGMEFWKKARGRKK